MPKFGIHMTTKELDSIGSCCPYITRCGILVAVPLSALQDELLFCSPYALSRRVQENVQKCWCIPAALSRISHVHVSIAARMQSRGFCCYRS